MRSRLLVICAAVGLLAAGCGGGPTQASCADLEGQTPMTPVEVKPDVEIPDLEPPDELCVEDIQEGTGAQVTLDSALTVHYVGVAWSTGEEFDAAWEGGDTAPFTLRQVDTRGLQEGLVGMREGGRRKLTIPPHMAYGQAGIPALPGSPPDAPPLIAPDETLVFVVHLIAVADG